MGNIKLLTYPFKDIAVKLGILVYHHDFSCRQENVTLSIIFVLPITAKGFILLSSIKKVERAVSRAALVSLIIQPLQATHAFLGLLRYI